MPNIPFPNVPNLPGVPQIPRPPGAVTVLIADIGLIQELLLGSARGAIVWGVFDASGKPLGNPADFVSLLSVNSVEYSKETKIADFPVERGGFATYNKVELPAEPTVTLCFSGTESSRRMFLDAIDAACKSVNLYSVVTPERTYRDYSIERYNYQRRSTNGATLLTVELSLKEIRQVSAVYSKVSVVPAPKEAGATPKVDGGKVQPTTPRQSVIKQAVNWIIQ